MHLFWNASLQGTFYNFGKNAVRHPVKTVAVMAFWFALGAFISSLFASRGDGDDEDDNYFNLPEITRRQNLCFKGFGKTWAKIPLPIEFRAIYGMGELCGSVIFHGEELTAHKLLTQISQILPIDFMGGQVEGEKYDWVRPLLIPGAAIPIYDAMQNKSFTGLPIYKDTPYNKNMPNWTKTYKNANKQLVELSAALNEASGGDKYVKGNIDLPAAQIEYLLRGYLGGLWTTVDHLVKSAETIFGDREFDWRNVPLANRFVTTVNDQTEFRDINNRYFKIKEKAEDTSRILRGYMNETNKGAMEYAEKIDFLYNSPDYLEYQIFKAYNKSIDELNRQLKLIPDDMDGVRKELENQINLVKKEVVTQIEETRDRK